MVTQSTWTDLARDQFRVDGKLYAHEVEFLESLNCPFKARLRMPCGTRKITLDDVLLVERDGEIVISVTQEQADILQRFLAGEND